MFNIPSVDARLKLFNAAKINQSNSCLVISETDKGGQGDVELKLSSPCISFEKMADNRLKYFKSDRSADGLIFEYKAGTWYVHIFELKTSLGFKQWHHAVDQICYSLMNALAIAGVLNITFSFENVSTYIVYSEEDVCEKYNRHSSANALSARSGMRDQNNRRLEALSLRYWVSNSICFPELTDIKFPLTKIVFTTNSSGKRSIKYTL